MLLLVDLSLQVRDLRWNLLGDSERAKTRLLSTERAVLDFAERLAERSHLLGSSPSGQVLVVAEETTLPLLSRGFLTERDAVDVMNDRLGQTLSLARSALGLLDDDESSHSLLQALLGVLEMEINTWSELTS